VDGPSAAGKLSWRLSRTRPFSRKRTPRAGNSSSNSSARVWGPFLFMAARRWCAFRSREGKEPGTTPGRAGDGAGDGREARVGRALPIKSIGHDGDGVAVALIVATEHSAGFEVSPGRAAMARQTLQEPQAVPIKPAKGLLLHAPGNHSPQQVFAQSRRRRSSKHPPPAPPKGIKRKRTQVSDLGRDRGRVCPLLPHGYALG
jgi:hypothetical protein